MKKYLVLAICSILISPVLYAEEDLESVNLELDNKTVDMVKQERYEINHEKFDFSKDSSDSNCFQPNANNGNLYEKKKFTKKSEKKIKNVTLGTQSETTFSANDVSQTSTLYSKYDINKKMSVDASYKGNTMSGIDNMTKGTVSVSPEYKVNKKVSLQNTFSKNMGNNSKKGEVGVKYSPFADERMNMNAGVGQTIYDNGNSSSSQVNFGTNIKF